MLTLEEINKLIIPVVCSEHGIYLSSVEDARLGVGCVICREGGDDLIREIRGLGPNGTSFRLELHTLTALGILHDPSFTRLTARGHTGDLSIEVMDKIIELDTAVPLDDAKYKLLVCASASVIINLQRPEHGAFVIKYNPKDPLVTCPICD